MNCNNCIKLEIQLSKSRTATTKARQHLSKRISDICELTNQVKEHEYSIAQARRFIAASIDNMDRMTAGNYMHHRNNVKMGLKHLLDEVLV